MTQVSYISSIMLSLTAPLILREKGWVVYIVGTPVKKGSLLSLTPLRHCTFRPSQAVEIFEIGRSKAFYNCYQPSSHSKNMSSDSSPLSADLPPAYTPHDLPDYTDLEHDPLNDRGNYARAIMMHNLRVNRLGLSDGSPPPSPSDTGAATSLQHCLSTRTTPTPSPLPGVTLFSTASSIDGITGNASNRVQDRHLRAALNEFRDTQSPDLWGRRVGHGRRAQYLHQSEGEGFWAWLGDLFLLRDERGNPVPLSGTSLWGLVLT